ncbi:riboflavin biosynthesis protein RibF [Coraliomargarita akajimensis]|uniref:Riboflavin biosynthesis protein n=1 Tax=Coraliomargarita akajimensis (strain DSM 45221 / IAM 15411 / JCM 23193 / KCTC 12865 / 04OKA010-24) TaxID=583355 RepID=D5EK61_CORAD|nr:riboflavin biosynthesis protein RibF [Coraliomargarita akajimensis]ADE54810.1 riboflavin biosynthesis protein RibF [Coraliomargarita akajimensis DSM 45221]
MELPLTVSSFSELSGLSGPLHLAIGMFDGVHLGHKAVIESAVFSAQRANGVSAVLTFDPHPSVLFRPQDPTRLIMPIEEKCQMLHRVGVDVVIRKEFSFDYAAIPADDFLARLKEALPALAAVYVGENFRFGAKRSGDVATLIETGRLIGLDVYSAPRIKYNGEPISSTRIRGDLESGRIESVNELLGYNYFADGEVVRGAQLGRTIGFPTLNLPWEPACRPAFGVYFVRLKLKQAGSPWAYGVANYGVKPTVAESELPALEIHMLEDTALDAGATVEVEWLKFIRPEQKFDSLDALKEQIGRDTETARKLASHG